MVDILLDAAEKSASLLCGAIGAVLIAIIVVHLMIGRRKP